MKNECCREWIDELVECARRGAAPSPRLSVHLWDCRACAERWNAESSLTVAMRGVRLALAEERSSESRKQELMAEFDRMQPSRLRPVLRWAWCAVAAILLAVGAWRSWQLWHTTNPQPAAIAGVAAIEETEGGEFVLVPFMQPLATGESVRIVHRKLEGAELARMGFDLPAGWSTDYEAEVMLGEDGIPHAVHLIGYERF